MKVDNKNIKLHIQNLDTKDEKIFIELEIISSQSLSHIELEHIKAEIQKHLKKRVVLSTSMKIVID